MIIEFLNYIIRLFSIIASMLESIFKSILILILEIFGLRLALVLNSSNGEDSNNEENSSSEENIQDEVEDSEDEDSESENNKNNWSESPPDRGSDEDPNDDDEDDDDDDDDDDIEEDSDDDPKETITEDLESVGFAMDGDQVSSEYIQRQYRSYFTSGTPTQEGLGQVRHYLEGELRAIENRENNGHVPSNEEDSQNKRKREEDENENFEVQNKRPKTDNNDSDNSGPSSAAGPSNSSGAGPSSSSGAGPSSSSNEGGSSSNSKTIDDYLCLFILSLSNIGEVICNSFNKLL